MARVIHMAHPGHPLLEDYSSSSFICDGCRLQGSGRRYGCEACDFWLHPYCATAPRRIQSTRHRHPLIMGYQMFTSRRTCDICDRRINGIYYTCNHCGIWDAHLPCAVVTDENRPSSPPTRRVLRIRFRSDDDDDDDGGSISALSRLLLTGLILSELLDSDDD